MTPLWPIETCSIVSDRFHIERNKPKGEQDHSDGDKWQSRRHTLSVHHIGEMPNSKIRISLRSLQMFVPVVSLDTLAGSAQEDSR